MSALPPPIATLVDGSQVNKVGLWLDIYIMVFDTFIGYIYSRFSLKRRARDRHKLFNIFFVLGIRFLKMLYILRFEITVGQTIIRFYCGLLNEGLLFLCYDLHTIHVILHMLKPWIFSSNINIGNVRLSLLCDQKDLLPSDTSDNHCKKKSYTIYSNNVIKGEIM